MEQVVDWQIILQKSKVRVGQLAVRALFVGMGLGGLFFLLGLSMVLFTDSLGVLLLSPVCLGIGFLLSVIGVARAWQIRQWPLLLVKANVLERRKATYRGVRYYVRMQILAAETFKLSGVHTPAKTAASELEYLTSFTLFNGLHEGETVTLICAPKLNEIVAQVDNETL